MLSRSSTTLSFSLQECLGLQPQMIHLKSLRVFRRKGKISWGSACDVTQSLAPLQLSWWITLLCGIILLLCRGEASQAHHQGRDDDWVKYVYNDVIHRNLQISSGSDDLDEHMQLRLCFCVSIRNPAHWKTMLLLSTCKVKSVDELYYIPLRGGIVHHKRPLVSSQWNAF